MGGEGGGNQASGMNVPTAVLVLVVILHTLHRPLGSHLIWVQCRAHLIFTQIREALATLGGSTLPLKKDHDSTQCWLTNVKKDRGSTQCWLTNGLQPRQKRRKSDSLSTTTTKDADSKRSVFELGLWALSSVGVAQVLLVNGQRLPGSARQVRLFSRVA